jgi:hypothetical protein
MFAVARAMGTAAVDVEQRRSRHVTTWSSTATISPTIGDGVLMGLQRKAGVVPI